MRQFFSFLFLFIAIHSFGQDTCTVLPVELKVCVGSATTLTAFADPPSLNYNYIWFKDGITLTDSTNVLVFTSITYADTGNYWCRAYTDTTSATSNRAHIGMYPKLTIDTLYRSNELGCPGSCKGQMRTHISGGNPPYVYSWPGELQDTLAYGLCKGKYYLNVFDHDSSHCVSREYTIETLTVPKLPILKEPGNDTAITDTVYLTNPYLTLKFPEEYRDSISTWTWEFGDKYNVKELNPATHAYTQTGSYDAHLVFTDTHGCIDSTLQAVIVMIAHLKINSLLTPNPDEPLGQGYNNTWTIKEIAGTGDNGSSSYSDVDLMEIYLSNEIALYNRWGRKVFSAVNYRSGDWDGGELSDGVYFYVFKGHGQYGDDTYHGTLTIMGRGFSNPAPNGK